MKLAPTDEQLAIAAAAADFLTSKMPVSRLHECAPNNVRKDEWEKLAQMGWLAVTLGEADGGSGLGLAEEILIFRALGRVLAPMGMIAASVGAKAAVRAGRADLVAALTGGEPVGLCAWDDDAAELQIFDAAGARHVAVVGRARVAICEMPGGALTPCLDPSSSLMRVAPNVLRPLCNLSGEVAARLFAEAQVLAAAMAGGAAEAARDMAAGYAGLREQFGKPIGAFQAIKHICADMAVRCEAAACQTDYAALAVRDGTSDAPFQAAAAKLLADRAALDNASANIQVHGGIGMTDECDAHLFLKRARILSLIVKPEPGVLLR